MTMLVDGYQTLIEFTENTAVKFIEKTVTPPGISAGGAIDTTNMANDKWRTKSPKSLLELLDSGVSVQWDPAVYAQIITMAGKNNLITITFPDATTFAFWGWLDTFDPGEMQEGEEPLADVTIIASNVNAAGVEVAPA